MLFENRLNVWIDVIGRIGTEPHVYFEENANGSRRKYVTAPIYCEENDGTTRWYQIHATDMMGEYLIRYGKNAKVSVYGSLSLIEDTNGEERKEYKRINIGSIKRIE